jgi:glyoxylase-like metal-dependent hydrolase (beta-lactamase superfamily II)
MDMNGLARPERQPSEVQHTAIGDILVSVVNDGLHQVSFDDLLANDRDACIRAHLGGFRSAPPWLTINCIVVRTGGRTALIDTGFSDKTPMVGRLIPNLETMGIAAGDIDMVLMTHMHPDHERGLIDAAGKPVFSNAELVVHEDEVAFWRDDAAMSRASEEGKGDFALARAALDAYADRLKTVKNDDVLPGVTAFPTPGHTPGHTAWHIESGKDSLLVWGDIVHFPGIQFAIPEASVVFDIDAQAAAASRRRMLSMAASEGMQVAGIHHDFPSVGHVVPDGSGFRFQHRIWSPLV